MAINNIFQTGMNAMDQSYARQQGYGQDRALLRAGQTLNTQGPAAAAGVLNDAGMIDQGRVLQHDAQAQQERAKAQQAAEMEKKAAGLIHIATGLKGVPPGQRHATLMSQAPMLQQLGIDPQPFAALTEDQLTNANLDLFSGHVTEAVKGVVMNKGDQLRDPVSGNLIADNPADPKYEQVDPQKDLYRIDGGGAQPAQGGGFDAIVGGVLKREGGYNASDGHSGNPVNFGINQGANPDINVAQLTPDQAKQIYKSRYWDAVGADQLPPQAQGPVFDAAVNQGVDAAKQMWAQSGGDVGRFNQLRIARYRQTPGYDKYGKAWEARVAESSQGAAPQAGPQLVHAGTPKPQEQWVDLPGGGQRNTATGETKNVPQPKGSGKLSATALNLQNDHLEALNGASMINSNLTKYEGQIRAGTLNLNPVNNIFSAGANMLGASTEASRNFASFRAGLEKLRNDSLRLNKGVQTEGDATRAWNELIKNIGDEGVVRQRLAEIKQLNDRAIAFRQDAVSQLREDSGLPPIDTTKFLSRGGSSAPQPKASARAGPQAIRLKNGRTATIEVIN
jgi:hypothetical protein